MSKGGLIIRLIDVVLILLLGFIGISDFTVKTQIKLPQGIKKSKEDLILNFDRQRLSILSYVWLLQAVSLPGYPNPLSPFAYTKPMPLSIVLK